MNPGEWDTFLLSGPRTSEDFMLKEEQRLMDYCEQIITAGILHKLLKSEGNPAAELLLQAVKEKSLGKHIHEINEERAKR